MAEIAICGGRVDKILYFQQEASIVSGSTPEPVIPNGEGGQGGEEDRSFWHASPPANGDRVYHWEEDCEAGKRVRRGEYLEWGRGEGRRPCITCQGVCERRRDS